MSRMGRPYKNGESPKSEQLNIRLSQDEKERIQIGAAKNGMGITDFIIYAASEIIIQQSKK